MAEDLRRVESDVSKFSLPERYLLLRGQEKPRPISIRDELVKGRHILVLARQGNVGGELRNIVILDLFPAEEGKVGMDSIVISTQSVVTRENCDDLVEKSKVVDKLLRTTLDPDQIGVRKVFTTEGWNRTRTGYAESTRPGWLSWTPEGNKTPRGEYFHYDLEIKGLDAEIERDLFGPDLSDDYVWSVISYQESELPTRVKMQQPLHQMAA